MIAREPTIERLAVARELLLAPFGLDATDPGFWSIGLSVIEGLIDELEAMEG